MLHTSDVTGTLDSKVIIGTKGTDSLTGANDGVTIHGLGGNDVITASGKGSFSAALSISAELSNAADSSAVKFTVDGVPKGDVLSAGVLNADGTWTLSTHDLNGLTLKSGDGSNVTLHVTATATDGSQLVKAADINVTFSQPGGDVLVGGGGNDVIHGGTSGDYIYGGGIPTSSTPTHVATSADNDVIFGGAGSDHIWGNRGDDVIWSGGGNDWISGGKGNDVIHGGSGNSTLSGNSGNDVFVAGGGNDKVVGGAGFDTIDFSNATGSVRVDLHSHTSSGYGNDWISGVEAVIGSGHDDIIWGDKKSNVLTGNGGNDTFGFHSSDVKKGHADHITDFNVGDKLDLSEMLHGRSGSNSLKVTDGLDGTTVSVKIGTAFVDVVTLDGVHGMTAAELLKAGMILV